MAQTKQRSIKDVEQKITQRQREHYLMEQLKTIKYLPKTLAKSLQHSVLPVPAGPAGFAI
jgi:ATP-dependent Lon protease